MTLVRKPVPAAEQEGRMTRTCMLVTIDFDASLLHHFDARQWNDFVERLSQRRMCPLTWTQGKRPSPIGVYFDFTGLSASYRNLADFDLTFCELDGASFDGANLRHAKIGSCPNATFRYAHLHGAEFRGNVSGCDFTGAEMDAVDLRHAYYSASHPPKDMSADLLARCEVLPPSPHVPMKNPCLPSETVLNVRATISSVPW